MLGSEVRQARLQPEVGEVGCGCDVDLVSALQVQHRGNGIQLLKCSSQVLECSRQFRGGPESRSTAYHQIDAEIVLESFDPLPDRCGRYPERARSRLERPQPQRQLERLEGL